MRRRNDFLTAGMLLGVGLGGFVDGILLHQLLQWHNMLASVVPTTDLVSMKVNMFWDGVFHAFTWITTLLGVFFLWRAGAARDGEWSGRVLTGAMLFGWGLFNLVEGLIDHQLLGLHHVRPGDAQLFWDLAYLASGALLMLVGGLLVRTGTPAHRTVPRRT